MLTPPSSHCPTARPCYLLIMACSQRKRFDATPVPALRRYDGPAFQVLRKWQRTQVGTAPLTILILSAEFGLITSEDLLPWYEHRLTPTEAANPNWQATLAHQLHPHFTPPPMAVFLFLGNTYWQALAQTSLALDPPCPVIRPPGGIGQKLAALHHWLAQLPTMTEGQV